MRSRSGTRPGRIDGRGASPRQASPPPTRIVVFTRVFVWGHLMGIAVYLVHGVFWLAAVGYGRLQGDRSVQVWDTLRLGEAGVLGRWVLGIVTLCLLLAGYRRQLGFED